MPGLHPSQASTSSVLSRAAALHESRVETIDGHPRSQDEEDKINDATARVLSSAEGEKMWTWLKQITINKVIGSQASHGEMAYQEGMRAIVALIEARRVASQTRNKKKASK